MKLGLNILLVLLIAFLGYLLVTSIQEPIAFKAEKDKRSGAVKERLVDIRTAQEHFREITGKFAHTFDTLREVLTTDSFTIENLKQDPEFPDDPDKFIRTVTMKSALDSINSLEINLDSLSLVPFSGGKSFTIETDTLTYQKTLVNVLQVSTRWKDFMGPFSDTKYMKYDNSYKPNNIFKFGDLSKPNLGGNWER